MSDEQSVPKRTAKDGSQRGLKAKGGATPCPDPKPGERLAKDGSRRGIGRKGKKNRATQLLEKMQEEIAAKYDIVDFDPVVMLAMIGVEAAADRVKVNYKGDIEYHLDDDGHPKRHPVTGEPMPIIVPADKALATNALSKAAPYVRSTLKQVELTTEDDGPIDADVVGAKAKLALMAGIELLTDDTQQDEEYDE